MTGDPCHATAAELAAALAAGETSARAVLEAHLERIAAINPVTNAVTVTLADDARAAADRADAAHRAGRSLGPLHGVPFTIKENLDCVGSATTHGVWALRRAMPYTDAPIVERMRAAGAIPIARTNLSEMGMRLCTDNPLRGRTRNPFDPRLTVGGSSGGDAAAVATGMAPIGLGNDMGGSLRIPAFCCGVAALKPTAGRVPHGASLPPIDYGLAGQLLLTHGPIARSIADLRLITGVISGRHRRDPRSVHAPLRGPPLDPPRAALALDVPGPDQPPAYVDAIHRAGQALEDAGWQVEHATPPEIERVNDIWGAIIATDFDTLLPQMRPVISESLAGHIERLCAAAASDLSQHRIHSERARLGRMWSGFFDEYPVVIGPNWGCPIWPVDADLDPDEGIDLLWETARCVLPANTLGLPAIAVPTGLVDGLPTGVQVQADLWREDLCFSAAEIIEAAVGRAAPIDPRGR